MNKKLLGILTGIIVVLLFSFIVTNIRLAKEKQKNKVIATTTKVVVANQNIPSGSTIVPSMIKVVDFPVKYIQPAVNINPNAALGKIALGDILKGEQILATKLTHIRKTADWLSVRIPPGKRALTLNVDTNFGIGGQVKAGDFLDILINELAVVNINNKLTTDKKIYLQYILVMGVKIIDDKNIQFTLALDPDDAKILSQAIMDDKKFMFLLRQSLDSEILD